MIYKIRVILDAKDSIFRDIEVKEKQTLWNLHLAIKSAFNLKDEEMSSFYFSDEDWTQLRDIPLEDMSEDGEGDTMADIYISEAFTQVGDKMLYSYGCIDLWEFFIELKEIMPEKAGVNYPLTTFRFGNVPTKAPIKTLPKTSTNKSGFMENIGMEDEFGEGDYDDYQYDDFEMDDEDAGQMDDYNDPYEF